MSRDESRPRLYLATQQPSNSATILRQPGNQALTNGSEVRKVSVLPVNLESVADVRALGSLEGDKIDGEVDGPSFGTIDEGDELEAGGVRLAELGQEVGLEDAGGADVLHHLT